MWRETALYVGHSRSRRHRQAARPACFSSRGEARLRCAHHASAQGGSGRPLGLRSSPCDARLCCCARHVSARRVACSVAAVAVARL
eukprot:scaffold20740_cov89-Phaeocystis_antarctica.AAC.1